MRAAAPLVDAPHSATADEVLVALRSDSSAGLTPDESRERVSRYGRNELPRAAGPGVLRRWWNQIRNPLVLVLVAAGTTTLAIGHYVDSAVIFGVVVLNAIVGYVQESRARQALDALTRLVRTDCTVLRAGQRHTVPSAELVPGDVVMLEAGDRVPADARLLATRDLECDESALTGESLPAAKTTEPVPERAPLASRSCLVHSGTLVTRGTARAVVVATGLDTEIGAVQGMVAAAEAPPTPLTRKLTKFSKQLTVAIVAVAVVTFAAGVLRGSAPVEMFIAAVALAVAAIPEGLPAVVTVVLAIGVVRMSRRRAVVRHLPAVETLGSTTVICSDKTGTITANEMTVVDVIAAGEVYSVSGTGFSPEGELNHRDSPIDLLGHPALVECLVTAVLCNDAELRHEQGRWHAVGDPTEVALLTVAGKAGLDWTVLRRNAARVDELPFESQRRMMATLNRESDGTVIGHAKGAVERIVEWCDSAMAPDESRVPLDTDAVLERAHTLAAQGLRVLACARFRPRDGTPALDEQDVRGRMMLVGLIAMHDAPREGVVEAVAACHQAGVAVKMITGDHPETARRVAAEIGLGARGGEPAVVTGAELAQLAADAFDVAAVDTDVFARVSPAQKLDLVEAFQRQGHVVAMTGDGINDAPALRKADIGVAMGTVGTEAARDASDMVLADDDFTSIEAAVEEGRGVFDNLRKFITWILPTNVGQGLVILTAVVLGMTLPVLPVQVLWINMTTAVVLGLTLAFEAKEPGIMLRPPRPPRRPLLTTDLVRRILLVSAVLVAGAFTAFQLQQHSGHSLDVARTTAINVIIFAMIAFLLSCRSLERFIAFRVNWWLFGGIGLMVLLQLALTYAPVMQVLFHTAAIGADGWLLVLAFTALTYLVVELDKALWRHKDTRAERVTVQQGKGHRHGTFRR
ncbi:HAD-IC family P-type ATPase [Haloechinothrix sp. LS1_15]|nr:HAD-IC family P-type ATPase [Haloechinothrix sp. LS1_15]